MAKHDKRFVWDDDMDSYYKSRTESLQEQLENAQRQVALKDSYIDKLEKALASSTDRCARLERALVEEKINNVQVS